ncbi:hypothetical protein D3C78_1937150 [compost metagenome]
MTAEIAIPPIVKMLRSFGITDHARHLNKSSNTAANANNNANPLFSTSAYTPILTDTAVTQASNEATQ